LSTDTCNQTSERFELQGQDLILYWRNCSDWLDKMQSNKCMLGRLWVSVTRIMWL